MLPLIVVSILLLAHQTAGSSLERHHHHDGHFDILIFTQHWPYTTCIDWENRSRFNTCSRICRTAWTVHGLWPTQLGKRAPSYCDSKWKFDYDSVKKIRPELDYYWPDYEMRGHPNSLWTHEWEKHGTCAAQLPAMDTEEKYFQTGIELAQEIPVTEWLKEKNIVPGRHAKYTKSQVYNAVMEKTGFRPHIDCENIDGVQFIKEIKVCFSKDLSLVHCDNIVSSRFENTTLTNSRGSCSENTPIVYPARIDPAYLTQPVTHYYTIGLFMLGCGLLIMIGLMVGMIIKLRNVGYETI